MPGKTVNNSKLHLRRGDKVQVISGKSRGHVGEILSIDREKERVIVEGANMQIKHMKPNRNNQTGGRVEKEGPIHYSNVLLYCPKSSKGERIRIVLNEKGEKRRQFVKSNTFSD